MDKETSKPTQNSANEVRPVYSDEKPKSKAVAFLSALIIVLAFLVVVLGWFYMAQKKEAAETQTLLIAEKDSIEMNLQDIMVEYQELETDNEKIQAKLDEEQERAEKLMAELKQVKSVSYAKIKEYQKELGTLRAIMRDMVYEIDSLNTLNQELIAENIRVRQEASQSKKAVESLEKKTEEMTQTIAKGSVVMARSIEPVGLNRRGKESTRARTSDKIRTCFILTENPITKPGSREVYVRIIGPDGFLLAQSDTNLFDFDGEKIIYSASREIDYQNEDVEMCIFYHDEHLEKGIYDINLYMDGYLIGFTQLTLK